MLLDDDVAVVVYDIESTVKMRMADARSTCVVFVAWLERKRICICHWNCIYGNIKKLLKQRRMIFQQTKYQ
jgi:hypothetical protein